MAAVFLQAGVHVGAFYWSVWNSLGVHERDVHHDFM